MTIVTKAFKNGHEYSVGPGIPISLGGTLLASAAVAISVAAAAPAALADGLSFTNYTTANGLGDNRVYGVYASGSNIYAATFGGGLSISTNGGSNWTNYTTSNGLGADTDPDYSGLVYGVYASGSNIYAATSGGLSISTNGGSNWTNYTTDNGLGSNVVYGVYASDGKVYAATDGGLSIAQQSDPTPSAVPGPLPLFGAASAFGFSRRLRSRLRSHSGAVARAAQA